eukprot:1978227-Lingulodinium_polyedra.AAC.1
MARSAVERAEEAARAAVAARRAGPFSAQRARMFPARSAAREGFEREDVPHDGVKPIRALRSAVRGAAA